MKIEVVGVLIENPETNGISVDGDRIEISGATLDPEVGRIVVVVESSQT